MMNINCSNRCEFEENGKCTLNHITPGSLISGISNDCAYFTPKRQYKNKENSQ